MRTAICIALAAIGITMFGCNWFTTHDKTSTAFNIEGKWKLDSLKRGNDSLGSPGWAAFEITRNDRNELVDVTYDFDKDSVVAQLTPAVSSAAYYKLDSSAKELTLKADTTENKFAFTAINDSLFSLTGSDSSVLWLKRQ